MGRQAGGQAGRQAGRQAGTWYLLSCLPISSFLSNLPTQPTTYLCLKVLACTHYTELLDVRRFARQPGLALWEMQARVSRYKST